MNRISLLETEGSAKIILRDYFILITYIFSLFYVYILSFTGLCNTVTLGSTLSSGIMLPVGSTENWSQICKSAVQQQANPCHAVQSDKACEYDRANSKQWQICQEPYGMHLSFFHVQYRNQSYFVWVCLDAYLNFSPHFYKSDLAEQ